MRTITAMFDSRVEAETARDRLAAAGISNDNVTIHDKTSLDGHADHATAGHTAEADGRAGTHRNAVGDYVDDRTGDRLMEHAGSDRTLLGDYVDGGAATGAHRADADRRDHDGRGLWSQIKAFFSGDDHVFEEGLRRGGYLLTARVDDTHAEHVIDILDDDGTVDLGARETSWRNEGWSGGNADAPTDRGPRSRVGTYPTDTIYS